MKGMRDIIILSILIGGGYYFFGDHIKFFFSEENRTTPYVDFYGADFAADTQTMIQHLHTAKVPYNYFRVDNDSDKKNLHEKMTRAGIDTKSYSLPVMNVNGIFFVNPSPETVIADYKAEAKKKADAS